MLFLYNQTDIHTDSITAPVLQLYIRLYKRSLRDKCVPQGALFNL